MSWIKLHRKLLEWRWASDPNMLALWIRILSTASYRECKYRNISLSPGQLVFGRKEWAQKTGISEQTLRTCINRLKSTGEISIKSTNKYSVLTILNWEFNQVGDNIDNQQTNHLSNQQLTSNQPATNHITRKKRK